MPHLVVIKWFYWVLSSCFILKCFDMFTCLFICFKNFVCQWFGLHDWCICWLLDGKLAVGIEGKCSSVFIQSFILFSTQAVRQTLLCYVEYKKLVQEAQLSPRDHAMRRVSWNLASCHATVQKLLVRQVLNKPKLWSRRVTVGQCVINTRTLPWCDRVASIVL